ncbi:MAG: DUF881 domain-containing protein [Clostridiaceae bacterium]
MRNNEANIFVFAACIIIGMLITLNINVSRVSSYTFLSSEQYMDAYNYKIKLHNEISMLVNQYNGYDEKLKSYQSDSDDISNVTEGIKKDLEESNMMLGKVDVEGQGIVIILTDADSNLFNNSFEDQFRLVHNTDIILVINDLINGGAEAISLNNQRISSSSEVYCSGPFIQVNGVKIAAPFAIKAIGNKQVLYDYMMSEENYLQSLILRKLNVQITRSDKVTVPAYKMSIQAKHTKALD